MIGLRTVMSRLVAIFLSRCSDEHTGRKLGVVTDGSLGEVRSLIQRSSEVHLKSADQLSKQPGPPHCVRPSNLRDAFGRALQYRRN